MTKLLLRLFVKDHNDSADSGRFHSAVGRLAGVTGIVCNVLLFAGKLIVGLLAGSVAISADAVNNLMDASSSVVTLLGFHMAQRPADEDHPYGHARYEYLSALVVAALILLIGAELAKSSVSKILSPVAASFSAAAFIVLLASICIKLWMSRFFAALGRQIGSSALKATAADCRNDVIASGAVLLSCVTEYFWGIPIDGYAGLAVALFIIYSGFNIARETISPLLGKQADDELVEQLSSLILSYDKILGIHDLLVHDYGPGQCYASVHAELSADEDPLVCHDIIDDIERDAMAKMNIHLVIHYDPVVLDDDEWNEMKQVTEEIVSRLQPQLSMHDFRIVRGAKQTKLVFDLAVPFSVNLDHKALKRQIDEALTPRGKHYATVIEFDRKG